MTKITVPNSPVTADTGNSCEVKVLEKISTSIINIPPKVIHRGIGHLVSLPTISLTKCGTTSPIQLIVPENATLDAVNSVAMPIIKS